MAETPTQKIESHEQELKSHFENAQTGVYGTYAGVKVLITLGSKAFLLIKMAADTQDVPSSIAFNSNGVLKS